jgi:translocator protein
MSVEPKPQKTYPFFWIKSSHRTWPEQAVGAAIFLLVSLAFEWLARWFIQISSETLWASKVFSFHWAFRAAIYTHAWTFYHFLTAFAMWNIWRRYSLSLLKIELSVFLSQLMLEVVWTLNFFVFHESLLALVALLFLCSNTILAALLYWKKERFSGQALILPFFWIFYVTGVNMAICILNP